MPFNRDYTIDPAIFAERPNKPTWNHKESIRKHEIVLIVKNINRTTGEIIRPHELVPGRRPPLPPPTLPPKEIRRKRSLDQFDLRQRRALLDKFPRPPSKDLPDLPPLNLPTGRPENKGGRLVDKPLDQVFGKRLPEPTAPLPHVPPPSLRNNLQVGSRDAVPARDLLPEPPNHRLFINRAAQTLAIAHEAEKRRDHSDRPSHSRSHQRSVSNNAALPRATEPQSSSVSRTNSYEGHSRHRKASNQTLPDKVLAYYGMEPSEPTRKESPVARSVQVVHQPRGSHRALKPEVDYRNSATLAATLSAGRVPTAAPPAYSSVYSDDSRGSTSSSVTVKASSRGSAAPSRRADVPQDVRAVSTYSSVSAYSQDSYITSFRPDSQAPPVPYFSGIVLPDDASIMSSAMASTSLSSYKGDASSVYSMGSHTTRSSVATSVATSRGVPPFRPPGPPAPPVPPLNIRNYTGSNTLISAPMPLQAPSRNASKTSISTVGHSSTSGNHGHSSSGDPGKAAVKSEKHTHSSDKHHHSSSHGSHSRGKLSKSAIVTERAFEELGAYGLDPNLFKKEKVGSSSSDRRARERRH